MKALTISQPFASLIASGEKWIENRAWPTSYRGSLAIHAGKGLQYLTKKELADYPSSCVIATARLVACVRIDMIRHIAGSSRSGDSIPCTRRRWVDAANHKHAEGPYCWILEDVQAIEPVLASGKQGLWEWSQP